MQNHAEAEDEELRAHLLETDAHFRELSEQHLDLKRQVEAIEGKAHITEADELEEQRLKKLKLSVKDQINTIVAGNRHASVR